MLWVCLTNTMRKLPNVTLILLSGLGYRSEENIHALKYSQKEIEFGAVKYIQLGEIKDIDSWSKAAVYELYKYVDTDFCLLVHENGFVVNPQSWRDEWLNYDYVGAPWPLPTDDYSYRTPTGELVRVGNSVSLRSRRLLELPSKLKLEWKPYFGFFNEDGFICVHNKEILEQNGCRFATIDEAKYFSRELDIPENADIEKPFCFHYNRALPGKNAEYYDLILKK